MVSRAMEWRNRLVEKGLDEEIADELVVGLPEQFASAADVRALDRRVERLEEEMARLRVDVARIDERLSAVERELAALREEMREELRALRAEFHAGQRAQTRLLVAMFAVGLGANIGVISAVVTLAG